jgi:hypothetical protein
MRNPARSLRLPSKGENLVVYRLREGIKKLERIFYDCDKMCNNKSENCSTVNCPLLAEDSRKMKAAKTTRAIELSRRATG